MNQVILTASNWLNFNSVTSVYMALVNAYYNTKYVIARRADVRHTINELNRLSDRELDDMGLHRGIIRDVAEGAHRD